jgi:hypothetical protein
MYGTENGKGDLSSVLLDTETKKDASAVANVDGMAWNMNAPYMY